jgi:hypothetical protein
MPVGWECFEVYPDLNLANWKPETATLRAEKDILAAVVARQLHEDHYRTLDPKADARRELGALLQRYKDLLDSEPEREEILQRFLDENPVLLCPTHVKKWPKLPLGQRKTDFVFREGSGEYILVELEPSTHKLFLKDGHPSKELNHARGQIVDWKRYLEDNLSTVQREYGLLGISTSPQSLIVIGRSRSLTENNRRFLVTLGNESPKLRILTYDDIYDDARAVVENLFGPLHAAVGNTEIYYISSAESEGGRK